MRTLVVLALVLSSASPALGAEPTVDPSDIVATGTVKAPPEVVSERLSDLDEVLLVAPEKCFRRWEIGPQVVGEGAQFRVVYLVQAFRRRLYGTVSKVVPGKRVEWNHDGNKGFVTRWSLEPVDGGTKVTAHTYIQGPPKPFRRYYTNTVQPAWKVCYEDLISGLDERITATWTPPPPAPPAPAPSPGSAAEPAEPVESDAPQHP
jgi:hypothetical protein